MALDEAQARAVIARYPSSRSAILPLLWLGQENDGFVTPETAAKVAELLGLPRGEVESVLSFYTMFRRSPPAKRRLQVCRSLACSMHGAEAILERIASETGVGPGQAAADGGFSVEVVECIAACDHAPAYLFNERMGGPLSPDAAMSLIRDKAPTDGSAAGGQGVGSR